MMRFSPPPHRILGSLNAAIQGPLVVAIGGIHGNEPAGVQAILNVLRAYSDQQNQGLQMGRFIGLTGNLQALAAQQRYIDQDLNRTLSPKHLADIAVKTIRNAEEQEALELVQALRQAIKDAEASELVLVDLHTTTAGGGDFSVVGDEAGSLDLAETFEPPVLLGMLDGLQNTTLHYINSSNLGLPTRCLVYEAGQHADPASIVRSARLLWSLLQTTGIVDAESVNPFERVPSSRPANLPSRLRVIDKLAIPASSNFEMLPGFNNFDSIAAGQHLAQLDGCPVFSRHVGYMLMPLYQAQGEDGFFIIA